MKSFLHLLLIPILTLLTFNLVLSQTNTYTGGSGAWEIASDWSLNHIPLSSEKVVLPNGADVTLTTATPALALTLLVESSAIFTTKEGTFLNLTSAGATDSRLENNGVIINQGTITISNNGTGNICVENSGNSAQYFNLGMLDINGYAGSGIHGISNSNGAEFTNESSGDIDIATGNNTSSGSGIDNTGTGTEFINFGNLEIQNVRNGITNTANAVFENESDMYLGDIKFDAGIENLTGAFFHNKANGYITLEGLNAVIGIEGIYNSATFINDGYFEIISPDGEGVDNRGASGYFENNGTLDISGVASTYGIVNSFLATWAGLGGLYSDKPFFQNSIYTTKGPDITDWNCILNLTGNAKDTLIINGLLGGIAGHDSIHVDGNLVLGGSLVIKSNTAYTTNFTDQFTLFTYTGILSGSFSTVNLPVGFSGFELDVNTPGKVILKHPDCNTEENLWIGPNGGKWGTESNWQLGHVPEICEKVVINSGDSVNILSGNYFIREMDLIGSLYIAQGLSLTVNGYNTTAIGVDISGKLDNKGSLMVENMFGTGAVRAIAVTNGVLENDGVIAMENAHSSSNGLFNSVFYLQNASNFNNSSTGEIYISNASLTAMRNSSTIPIYNHGLIQIQNCTVGYGIWNLNTLINTGSISINNINNQGLIATGGLTQNEGTISVNGAPAGIIMGGSAEFANNGIVTLSNTTNATASFDLNTVLTGSGSFINDAGMNLYGKMSPGNSAGVISISNTFRQIGTPVDTFEIFGTDGGGQPAGHDSVHVGGFLEIQGKIVVQLKNGFVPSNVDRFVLFSYGTQGGTFDDIELPTELSNWVIDFSVVGEIALARPPCTIAENTWTGANGSWNVNGNWSLGHVPTYCEDVVIGNGRTVTIPNGVDAEALSIKVEANAKFIIANGATASIDLQFTLGKQGIDNEGLVENNGNITIRNSQSGSCIESDNGGDFKNFGVINISSLLGPNAVGILSVFSSSFTNEVSGQIFISDMEYVSSASIGSGLSSELINKGNITITNGGSIAVISSGIIENFGAIVSDTVQAAQCINISGEGIFYNHTGSQLTLKNSLQNGSSSNGITIQSADCQFINDGNITISKIGTHGIFIPSQSIFKNNGTVGISNTGLLSASGKDVIIEGTYNGTGELYGNNEMILDGICSPGNSTSQLYFENTIIHSSSNIDSFEIGGTTFNQYDNMYILDGDLTLGGLIDIKLINGFMPNDNDIFTLFEVDGGTISGTFLIVVLPVELAGWELDFSILGEVRLLKPACTGATNTWTGTNGLWNDASKWSLGHAPRYCEDVVINSGGNVSISDFYHAVVHSVDVNGGQLFLNPLAKLTVDVDNGNKRGIENRNGGVVFSGGDINIFDINGPNKDGIYNCSSCTFTNNFGSELHVFNIAGGLADGVANLGDFTNSGIITINNIVHSNGIISSLSTGDFSNSGNITIDNILNDGIQILSNSNFLNTGIINVSGCGNLGIRLGSGAFFDQDGDVMVGQ